MKKCNLSRLLNDNYGDPIPTKYVDVLDGIRALAILTVAHFHLWQQSWWTINIRSEFLTKLGLEGIMLEWLQRYGSLFVDMMILLTGFCLFLPYARQMIEGGPEFGLPNHADVNEFYIKRIARIVPSYYFCTLVYLFFFILPDKNYAGIGEFFADKELQQQLFANMTFTQMHEAKTYVSTPFNGALWTVAVEMQFYLIFPLLAWCMKKKPVLTFLGMTGLSYYYINFRVVPMEDGYYTWHFNQMPALLCVFACGMMGALLYTAIANNLTRERYSQIFFTILSLASFLCVRFVIKTGPGNVSMTRWQLRMRFLLAVLFMVFVISTALSVKWYRFIFSNRVMRFIAGISYNLYIWHQVIAVKLKMNRIPYWDGDELPNIAGNKAWMKSYTLVVVIVAFAAAILVTYLIEKPASKLIMKLYYKGREKRRGNAGTELCAADGSKPRQRTRTRARRPGERKNNGNN